MQNLQSPALRINSVPDHIHILFRLSTNYALAKVLEEIKKQSSKWMKEVGIIDFTWQIGYAAFSVSSSKLDSVIKYIDNQKEHHSIQTFQQEVEEYCKEYNIVDYDSVFFWE